MSKSKWVDTLKGTNFAANIYRKRQSNLALNADNEPAESEDEWSFDKEIHGKDVEITHAIQLRHEKGIALSLRRNREIIECYVMRLHIRMPHLVRDTVHVLPDLFPAHIPHGAVRGRILYTLGFDRYFRSQDTGCTLIDMFLTDNFLDLESYSGTYGGQKNLRLAHTHSQLEVVPTPEWIWTPGKP